MLLPSRMRPAPDVAVAGGKGASLARMTALGMPVPPGFVVPADALEAALAETATAIRAVLARGARREDLAAISAEAIALVRARRPAARPGGGRRGVRAPGRGPGRGALQRDGRGLGGGELRGAAGDLPARARRRRDRGADPRRCWCSFFTERALFYRRQGVAQVGLAMAVVVQRMVKADAAGVLFTIDPTHGRTGPQARRGRPRAWRGCRVGPAHPRPLRAHARRAGEAEQAPRSPTRSCSPAGRGTEERQLAPEVRPASPSTPSGSLRLATAGSSSRSASAGRRTSSGRSRTMSSSSCSRGR